VLVGEGDAQIADGGGLGEVHVDAVGPGALGEPAEHPHLDLHGIASVSCPPSFPGP